MLEVRRIEFFLIVFLYFTIAFSCFSYTQKKTQKNQLIAILGLILEIRQKRAAVFFNFAVIDLKYH